ncbi:MAG: putative O-glycosylation ligase, exosortase A system-associated [Geminicoccaceae bacterium]
MRDIVVTLIVCAMIPLILRRPFVGLMTWSWLSYMNPHRLTWGFAQTLPFAQIVFLVTFASWLWHGDKRTNGLRAYVWLGLLCVAFLALDHLVDMTSTTAPVDVSLGLPNGHGRSTGPIAALILIALMLAASVPLVMISAPGRMNVMTPLTWLLLAFCGWTTVTTLTAYFPQAAFDKWLIFFKIIVATVLGLLIIDDERKLKLLVLVIGLSIGFLGVKGGLFTIINGGQYIVFGPKQSFMSDNNNMALAFVMAMPLMYFCLIHSVTSWQKWLMWFVLGTTLLATVATYSRGGFVALAAVLAVLWLRSRRKVASSIILVFVAVIALTFMPQEYRERIRSIADYEQDGSAQSRFSSWSFAIDAANQSPLTGGGYKVFYLHQKEDQKIYRAGYSDAHSIYFEVLGEHGYVGLLMFLALGVASIWQCQRMSWQCRGDPHVKWLSDLAQMLQLSIIAFAVGGAFLTLATFDLYYQLLALVVLAEAIMLQQRASKPLPAPAIPQPSPARSLAAPRPTHVGKPARAFRVALPQVER